MEIALYKIDRIINIGVELGAITTLIKTGQLRPYLKKTEANKIYGRKNIRSWFDAGLITYRQDGSGPAPFRLDRLEIEILVRSFELAEML
jgi:hypothetical protein